MKTPRKNSNSLRDYFFSHFGMTKRQRSGFFILILFIIALELIIQFYTFKPDYPASAVQFTPTEEALFLKQTKEENKVIQQFENNTELNFFNPNALDHAGFVALGFSEKQASSLIKYRYSLGGNFSNIDEFAAAFVISDRMMETLEPYIQLKPFQANLIQNQSSATHETKFNSHQSKIKNFDPNSLSHQDWMNLGFSERQASSILNFKNSLSNKRFENLDQIKSCYVINDYMFERIKNYVRFSNITHKTENSIAKEEVVKNFNPNTMISKDWQSLGWNEESADNILKYKEFIGGFKSLEDLMGCKYISAEDLEKIKNRLVFDY